MPATNNFYRTREADARREAAGAKLDNVRHRHLHAATAWAALAVRFEKTERHRAEEQARRTAALDDSASGEPPAALAR